MRPRHYLLLLLSLALSIFAPAVSFSDEDPVALESNGDRFYEEQSWGQARTAYEQLLTQVPDHAKSPELRFRIAFCSYRLNEFVRARGEANKLATELSDDNIWGVCAMNLEAQVWLDQPHWGTRTSDAESRGEYLPNGEYFYAWQEDFTECMKIMMKAIGRVKLYEWNNSQNDAKFDAAMEESRKLRFLLADVLEQNGDWYIAEFMKEIYTAFHGVEFEEPPHEKRYEQALYDWGFPLEMDENTNVYSRVGFLYESFVEEYNNQKVFANVNASDEAGRRTLYASYRDVASKALYRSATYLVRSTSVYSPRHSAYSGEEIIVLDTKINPLPVLQRLIDEFEGEDETTESILAEFFKARVKDNLGDYKGAEEAYAAFIENHPANLYAEDSKAYLQELRKPRVNVNTIRQYSSEEKVEIEVINRNVESVKITAYKVRLNEMLADRAHLRNPNAMFHDLTEYYSDANKLARFVIGEPQTWSFDFENTADHHWSRGNKETPVGGIGAYVIKAEGGSVASYALLIVSDLAFIERYDFQKFYVFAVNKITGAPIEGTSVRFKEVSNRWEPITGRSFNALEAVIEGETAEGGMFEKDLPPYTNTNFSRYHSIFAWSGDNYAITTQAYRYARYNSGEQERIDAHITTDRPVYRPDDKVNLRAILKQRNAQGRVRSLGNSRVGVEIYDTQGNKVLTENKRLSDFGTVNGEYTLPENAPLGNYSVQLTLFGAFGGSRTFYSYFAVEEYRQPEFEVSVTNLSSDVVVGDTFIAAIDAKYYFGEKVSGGHVKYTVYRSAYWPRSYFPYEYGYLYDYGDFYPQRYGYWYSQYQHYEEVVLDAEGELDEDGRLIVEVDTKSAEEVWGLLDHQYRIVATVQDESRQIIDGSGTVRVTKKPFFITANTNIGFAIAGDTVETEFRCETPSGSPLRNADGSPRTVPGTVKVFKLREVEITQEEYLKAVQEAERTGEEARVRQYGTVYVRIERNEVLSQPAEVDVNGRCFFRWTADDSGKFDIALFIDHTDSKDRKYTVEGYATITVYSDQLDGQQIRFANIEIVPEKRNYEVGENAKLLFTSNFSECDILVTLESGEDIMARRVVHLTNRAKVFNVLITEKMGPNFFISARVIKSNTIYQNDLELFVPPVDNFITVEIETPEDVVAPGSEVPVKIKTTDKDGNPVSAEVALRVIDESVFYIAADNSPNIIKFFYGNRRYRSEYGNNSLYFTASTWSKDSGRYESYTVHRMPPGFQWFSGWRYFERENINLQEIIDAIESEARDANSLPNRLRAIINNLGGMLGGDGGGGRGGYAFGGEERLMEMDATSPAESPRSAPQSVARAESGRDLRGADGASSTASEDGDITVMNLGMAQQQAQGGAALAEARLRSNFADTAYWNPSIVTNAEGVAEVKVPMPDSLTRWNIKAVATGNLAKVGEEATTIVTKKRVQIRAHPPRFAVERDEFVLSATVDNLFDEALSIVTRITIDGGLALTSSQEFVLAAGAQSRQRIDFNVVAAREGRVTVKLEALSTRESDAMEIGFDILPYGARRFEAETVYMAPSEESRVLSFQLPVERRIDDTTLRIALQPSMIMPVIDAIPYLIKYPYGCVEQTMSRFFPAVMVRKTLQDLGISLEEIRESRNRESERLRHLSWASGDAGLGVFDTGVLNTVVDAGMRRIQMFQHGDGGWGWWRWDDSDPYMTAYVLQALSLAQEADVKVDQRMIDSGFAYLKGIWQKAVNEEYQYTNLHLLTFIASVCSNKSGLIPNSHYQALWTRRDDLNFYSRAYLATALYGIGEKRNAEIILENFEGYAEIDEAYGRVHFERDNRGGWWYWYNDRIETNAAILNAYLTIKPDHRFVPMLANWLATNRNGVHWYTTKQSAFSIMALSKYVSDRKEFDVDYDLSIRIGGEEVKRVHVDRSNLFTFDSEIVLAGSEIPLEETMITVEKFGTGQAYVSAYLDYFSTEEHIGSSGNEIEVQREYYLATPTTRTENRAGREIEVRDWTYEKIEEGRELKSGDEIEVRISIKTHNDFEYLVFEDYKPAGCEPKDLRSGGRYGNGVYANVELRDELVAFFATWMNQGDYMLKYRIRAEIPGAFHALPTQASAMYAPELRANSDSFVMRIVDR
ncbi:MAG: MG2 domain-containing protein [Planctomycetes bacterium]|nr:MG2 domain-containing protein [Planctomycetota bacterium]